ncbi:TetR/AcrR family transcriptional regulator [Pseudomonas profundi]|uniref:TetR/AcrR family transcriptional regulator n=1 Tax=Pseudomonas profundi TaxID=1981513 RepID=UPI001239304B|nr:TetR/AcrR family transcriptional regulator [Pseudomonas profundi]
MLKEIKSAAKKPSPDSEARAPDRPKRNHRNPEKVIAGILAAAIDEFSTHGFAGARIDRISKKANTADRMLYYYFGNKESLYEAVLEEVYRRLTEEQRRFVAPKNDPVAALTAMIVQIWDNYVKHPEFIRLIMSENLLYGRFIRQSATIKNSSSPLVEVLDQILQDGKEKGIFRRNADTSITLMTIMSLGFFYISNQYTYSFWLINDMTSTHRSEVWLAHIKSLVLNDLLV